MSVFITRGCKDPFHLHVAQSLAKYLSQRKRAELRGAIEESDFDGDELLELLEEDMVTAWAGQSYRRIDRELLESMSVGDYHLMRTGQPSRVQYIQQIDLLLGNEAPDELRQRLSQLIGGSDEYDSIRFSKSPVLEVDCPQDDFVDLIREANREFEFDDWFPSQQHNGTQIDPEIVEHFGGDEQFIERLAEWDGEYLEPGADNYFLLNAEGNRLEVRDEHRFDFKLSSTEYSTDIIEAENHGRS